jgi:hypothetical protein
VIEGGADDQPLQAAARRGRPFSALLTVAALFLLFASLVAAVVGAVAGLFGLLRVLSHAPDPPEGIYLPASLGPFLLGVAAIAVAFALAQIVAALGILGRRGWGRILGFASAAVGIALTLPAVLERAAGGERGGLPFDLSLILLAGYAFTMVTLALGGEQFRRHA